ncbi:hypothetical protein EAI30_18850, partial [Romboutsia ilealis]|nr:hypothetical protein [Romboutsia ilealis]
QGKNQQGPGTSQRPGTLGYRGDLGDRGSYINCRKAKRILWPGKTSGASDGAAPDAGDCG